MLRAAHSLLAAALVMGACGTAETAMPAPEQASLSWDTLRFDDATTATRAARLRRFAEAGAAGWRHEPLRAGGSFVQERWCGPGISASECQRGLASRLERPGVAWFELATLAYNNKLPEVFGLSWSAGALPAGDGWGCALALTLRGRGVAGSQLSVEWMRLAGGAVVERLHAGVIDEITVAALPVRAVAPAPEAATDDERSALRVEATLAALLASPEELSRALSTQLGALQDAVDAAVASDALYREEPGEYKGDGIPPVPKRVPLTPNEAQTASTDAAVEIGRRQAIVDREAAHLHAALAALVPPGLLEP